MLEQLKTEPCAPLLFFIDSMDENSLNLARIEIRVTLTIIYGVDDQTSHANLITPSGELLSFNIRSDCSELPTTIQNSEKESAQIIISNPFVLWRDVGSRIFNEIFEQTSLKVGKSGKSITAERVGVSRQQIHNLCKRDAAVTQSIFQSLLFVTIRNKYHPM